MGKNIVGVVLGVSYGAVKMYIYSLLQYELLQLLPCICMCAVGLGNWLCLSVSQYVSWSTKIINLQSHQQAN